MVKYWIRYIYTYEQASFGASLPTKTSLTSKEAVIAAAASEAVALAREAAKTAKDAVMMVNHINSTTSYIKALAERPQPQLRQTVDTMVVGESEVAQSECVSDVVEPTAEEAELLQAELVKSIAVRSRRQPQRKARRARAAKKTSATVVSVKSGSSSQKRRGSREIDHSDPLRYLRQTSTSSILLTATEERELSKGIQVYLNSLNFDTLFKTITFSYQLSPLIHQHRNLIMLFSYSALQISLFLLT